MAERRLTGEEEARRDQAIAWHVRLDAPGVTEAEWIAFSEWLEADPANSLMFDRVESLDEELRATDLGGDRAPLSVVISRPGNEQRPRRQVLWFGGAAALLAASIAAFAFIQPGESPVPKTAVYATRIGETKTVALADGTNVDLNTATALSVEANRHVTLMRGEALFHVSKDAAHPFIVTAGDRQVRVVGTVFNVLRDTGTVTVTVSEGLVAVTRTGRNDGQQLGRGDRLTCVEGSDVQSAERVDPAEAISWREGYLIYRNAPLSRVVADLNRYFAVEVVLEGNAPTQKFTGVLRVDKQDAVLRRLTEFLPVVTFHRPDGKIGLRQASPPP